MTELQKTTLKSLVALCLEHDVSFEFYHEELKTGAMERRLIIRLGEEIVVSFNEDTDPKPKYASIAGSGKVNRVSINEVISGIKLFSSAPVEERELQKLPADQHQVQSLFIAGTVKQILTPLEDYENYPIEWIPENIKYVVEYIFHYENDPEDVSQEIMITVENSKIIHHVGSEVFYPDSVYRPGVGVFVKPYEESPELTSRLLQIELTNGTIQKLRNRKLVQKKLARGRRSVL